MTKQEDQAAACYWEKKNADSVKREQGKRHRMQVTGLAELAEPFSPRYNAIVPMRHVQAFTFAADLIQRELEQRTT